MAKYTRWSVLHKVERTQGRVYTRWRHTNDEKYIRWSVHTVKRTHGEAYTRWDIHTVRQTHGGDIHTAGHTHGGTYTR